MLIWAHLLPSRALPVTGQLRVWGVSFHHHFIVFLPTSIKATQACVQAFGLVSTSVTDSSFPWQHTNNCKLLPSLKSLQSETSLWKSVDPYLLLWKRKKTIIHYHVKNKGSFKIIFYNKNNIGRRVTHVQRFLNPCTKIQVFGGAKMILLFAKLWTTITSFVLFHTIKYPLVGFFGSATGTSGLSYTWIQPKIQTRRAQEFNNLMIHHIGRG